MIKCCSFYFLQLLAFLTTFRMFGRVNQKQTHENEKEGCCCLCGIDLTQHSMKPPQNKAWTQVTRLRFACRYNTRDRWQEGNAVWLRQPGVWQGHALVKWEECVVTLLRGTLWTAWQWHESVNMPVFTVHPFLCRPAKTTTLQFNFHTTEKCRTAAVESLSPSGCGFFAFVSLGKNMFLWVVGW